LQLIRLVVKEKHEHENISVVCSHSDSVTLGFVQCCLDNDRVSIFDFVFKEIMQQSNKATFIVLVTEECLLAGNHHSVTGANDIRGNSTCCVQPLAMFTLFSACITVIAVKYNNAVCP